MKERLAESNSHQYVVPATNLYLPRYDAEPTGDKRIQLELVRLCVLRLWSQCRSMALFRTEYYQQDEPRILQSHSMRRLAT